MFKVVVLTLACNACPACSKFSAADLSCFPSPEMENMILYSIDSCSELYSNGSSVSTHVLALDSVDRVASFSKQADYAIVELMRICVSARLHY